MLTVKHNHNTVKKADIFHSTGKKQLASTEEQGRDRTYNKDSFYLPVSDKSGPNSPTLNVDTGKNSSELFCDVSPCCLNLEMIRLNDDKRCLSQNISNHTTRNKNNGVHQFEQEKNTNASSKGNGQTELRLDWGMNVWSLEPKKKGHSFNKT